jgi:hypothetical protein
MCVTDRFTPLVDKLSHASVEDQAALLYPFIVNLSFILNHPQIVSLQTTTTVNLGELLDTFDVELITALAKLDGFLSDAVICTSGRTKNKTLISNTVMDVFGVYCNITMAECRPNNKNLWLSGYFQFGDKVWMFT